jgi:hypothetical protein
MLEGKTDIGRESDLRKSKKTKTQKEKHVCLSLPSKSCNGTHKSSFFSCSLSTLLDEKKMMMMNGMKEKVWSIGHG